MQADVQQRSFLALKFLKVKCLFHIMKQLTISGILEIADTNPTMARQFIRCHVAELCQIKSALLSFHVLQVRKIVSLPAGSLCISIS